MTDSRDGDSIAGIAVIGMAGRFPGARNVSEFWSNLREGVESISFFSDETLAAAGVAPETLADPAYVKAKAALEDVELFDASFFGLNPREAELTDPQHRLLLECSWEALEDAGYDPKRYEEAVGVFGGVSLNTYLLSNLLSNRDLIEATGFLQASIRNRTDHATTHVSYKLGLRGPGVTVQTACSTSLVAVHLACQSLLSGECDMALAGGASVSVPQKSGYLFQEGGIFSPDGHCRAFDAGARGTVDGNGAAVVLLKRLEDAIADGDNIRAVIRGSAINNDGSNKVGYTAPSVEGQAQVIAEAQAVAEVEPDTITYVETHGTGTVMGDPIEVTALRQVFEESTTRRNFCALGSVKTNIGHLDAAAGVAGLVKTVLALEHGELPPSLHFERPNPAIDFENSPFYVSARTTPWDSDGGPRRAGVSSFGIGGTNAHVVLEEAPEREGSSAETRPWQLLLLSAKTSTALEQITANLHEHLSERPGANLADVAHTLQVGRGEFNYRRAIVVRDYEDALDALGTLDPRRVHTGFQETKERPLVFMFPGQGAQYVGMGRDLYEHEPVFREEVDACAELLRSHLGFDLREVIYPAESQAGDAQQPLSQTYITQPALFVIEYALARLLLSWGLRPEAMIGHSIGEYVAACLAGVMTLPEALALVAARGRLVQSMPGGSMLVVPLPEHEVLPLLADSRLSLAAVNGPALCVVSGPDDEVERLERQLAGQSVAVRRLHTSHAFHSEMMEPVLESFLEELRKVEWRAPQVPFLSNVSGTWITEAEATSPEYWARHLRQTVRFSEGVRELLKEPDWILLEVGPGRTLGTLARWNPFRASGQVVLNAMRHPEDPHADENFLLTMLGKLWLAGTRVDWSGFYARERRRRVALPTYAFERQRYWVEPQAQSGRAHASPAPLGKIGDLSRWFYVPSWKRSQLVRPHGPAALDGERNNWLLLSDEAGLGARLAGLLRDAGQRVTIARAGEAFASEGEHAYTLNPGRREDFDALFKGLREANSLPDRVIHLWNLTAPGAPVAGAAPALTPQLERSFYSLIYLAQAVGAENPSRPLDLLVVSSNVHEVVGGDCLRPEQALASGPCKVIPQEYSHVTCRQLDLDYAEATGALQGRLAEALVREMTAGAPEPLAAYRGARRWVQDFEAVRIESPNGSANARLRERGVYLITGGLGGVGLSLAEHLAQSVQARLVLVGRTPFPARDAWERWLETEDEQDAVSLKIRRLQALEAAGAELLVLSADVSDESQVREVVRAARAQFGRVDGVVHAAGVAGGGVIQLKTHEAAEAVFAPKVRGTLALASALADSPPDFFINCSSRSAILGGFGQSDYSAANAFLDAFSHYHAARTGAFTVSVNWDAWDAVGMLAAKASLYGVGGREEAHDFRKVEHPLLDRGAIDAEGREIYQTVFSPLTHWVLDEHRIVGNAVVPGTAYLEMARAAAERHAPEGTVVEIRDAFFLAPLGLRDDERRVVRTVIEKTGDGYDFHVFSRPGAEAANGDGEGGEGEAARWQEYALGKVGFVEAPPPRRVDIAAVIERCNVRRVVLHDEYKRDEDLGPRWQALKRLYLGERELLAYLELPEQFEGELDLLKLHPALLDRATGTGKEYLVADGVYLPMGYRRLRMGGALTRKIYTHIRFRADENDKRQTIAFDVTFTDEHGNELVDIEAFTQKRVNDIAGQIKALAKRKYRRADADEERPEAARPNDSLAGIYRKGLSEGMSPKEGAEAFSRILSADVPPQVVVSTKDLRASLEQSAASARADVAKEIEKLQVARPTHARPDIQTGFVGATDELEKMIAEVWQDMLGIAEVGVHDNFFELGGDSVQAIQIISRINGRGGLQLTPQQLFQNQTVAELAAVARTARAVHAEQGEVTGEVTLTPTQQQFFEQEQPEPHHHNQAVMLEVHRAVEPATMEDVLERLLVQHDALRARFERTPTGWRQTFAPSGGRVPFTRLDLSGLAEDAQLRAVEETAAHMQSSLNLTEGPVLHAVYFDLGSGRPGRLLLLVHYLVADGVSLRLIMEDLQTAFEQLGTGAEVKFQPKTTSYKYWAGKLAEYADSEGVRGELDYWTSEARAGVAPLPVDKEAGDANTELAAETVTVALDAEQTRALQEVPQKYHMQLNEVLLTALAVAVTRWTGSASVLVDLEGHGREDLFPEVNLGRTVGAFTTLAPVLLDCSEGDDPATALKAIKEQVRGVPRHGIGYGLLRYLSSDAGVRERLRTMPRPEIRFNYLGQLDQVLSDSSPFRPAHEEMGPAHSPLARRTHLLDFNGMVAEGELRLEWRYSENVHRRDTIEYLSELYLEELRGLIEHCLSIESGDFTPSDFPLANLDRQQFDKLTTILSESETGAAGSPAAAGGFAPQAFDEGAAAAALAAEAPAAAAAGGNGSAHVELQSYRAEGGHTNGHGAQGEMGFSLFYFADDDTGAGNDKYRLCLEGAKFADRHGFEAVWTPERHFHEKAGLYPNPSVLSAALAIATGRLALRAGSVALPLHNPLRVAEEWAMVDNLSGGRVGVSFTSGWVPNDFAFFPERYPEKKGEMFRLLEDVRRLWRGESIRARDGVGNDFDVHSFPRPVQPELPVWLTCSGGADMFVKAGEMGVNVLTALLAQSVEEAATKIKLYREARAKAGHDPAAGRVTMMMHTFVGTDTARVLERVRVPLSNYLRSHINLIETYAKSMDIKVEMERDQWVEALVGFAFERYYRTASLIGTPETCLKMVGRLRAAGVDEVACLIDFGVEADAVLESLTHLNTLKELARADARAASPAHTQPQS